MTTGNQTSLETIADQAMIARGFKTDFNRGQGIRAASALRRRPAPPFATCAIFLWISIDNDDSKDLDQLTYAERTGSGQIMVYVAVADVDGLVKKGDPIDRHASFNTTSVYTPAKIFPMLPLKLSTDLTSLNQDADRCAVVVQSSIEADGRFTLIDIYLAVVRNKAKLTYNGVSGWLGEGNTARTTPGVGQAA